MSKSWVIGGLTDCNNMRFLTPSALEPLVSIVPPIESGATWSTDEEDWQRRLWVSNAKKAKKLLPAEARALVKKLRDGYARLGFDRIKIRAMTLEQRRRSWSGRSSQRTRIELWLVRS